MIELKLYGQHTSTYEYVKLRLKRRAAKADLDLRITEINDWEEIVNEKVMSLPTVRLNDHIDLSYQEGENVNDFIQKVTAQILKEENYGNMKKILVPTDFSDVATNALVYAHGMSKALNGVVQLVHVYKPEVVHVESVVVIDAEIEKMKRKQLEDYVSQVNQSWVGATDDYLPIDGTFKVGFVVDELKEMCEDEPDQYMVIAGSTGSSGGLKTIFGSVTTQLARSCPSPLLLIPGGISYQDIGEILYAVDDAERDLKVLPQVIAFCERFNSKLHLVHVRNDDSVYPHEGLLAYAGSVSPATEVEYHSLIGKDIPDIINQFAIRQSIDIVSVATQERGFFANLFHKSTSRKMAITTEIPLLIFHV